MFRWVYFGLLLFCLMTTPNSFAATIHVPADQPTIQAGINAAVNGDTVLVAAGSYAENLWITKNIFLFSSGGESATSISPAAEASRIVDAANAVLTISGFTFSGCSADRTLSFDQCKVRIEGCTVRDNMATQAPVLVWGNSGLDSNCVVINCTFSGNSGGSYSAALCLMDMATPSSIRDSRFFNNAGQHGGGITGWSAYNVSVTRCLIYNNQVTLYGSAIFGGGFSSITNNTIVNNATSYDGSCAVETGGVGVRNNIIVGNQGGGVNSHGDYNDVWNNSPADYVGAILPGLHDINANPLLVDTSAHDYRLSSDSPCIDAGDPAQQYDDPDGTRNDIGALCFDQTYPWAVEIRVGETGNRNVVNQVPTIVWSCFSPDSATQMGYEAQVGSDNDWSIAEMWQTGQVAGGDSSCAYAGGSLQDGLTYFGRIRLLGDSLWGMWRSFSFRMNSIPMSPVLQLPVNISVVALPQPPLIVRNSADAENDSLFYTFEVSSDSFVSVVYSFATAQDADSLTTLVVDSTLVENARYWWRVAASDYYETSSYSPVWSFYVNSVNTEPMAFALVAPANILTPPVATSRPLFSWNASSDPDPFDSVRYTFVIAIDAGFLFAGQISGLTAPSYTPVESLMWGTRYWWKVKAGDLNGGFTWSNEVFTFRTMMLGDADGNAMVSLADAVFLITYIFAGGAAPAPIQAGDADCNGLVSIADAVYLVNYVFGGGPAPCEGF